MALSVNRFLPKQVPTDVWSLREKLALACAVKRSGDNNWVSVSRAIRPYGEPNRSYGDSNKTFGEPNRPSDWFSQKNCALQYSDLLEKVETPKRKRGERETSSAESPGDVIIRKLTIERIEELKRIVQEEEQRYKKLKRDVEDVLSGQADDRLDEMLDEIEREKKANLEAEKKWAEELAARDQAKQRNRKVIPGLKVKAEPGESPQPSPADALSMGEDDSSQPQSTDTVSKSAPITAGQSPATVHQTAEVKQEDNLITTDEIKQESQDVVVPTGDVKAETPDVTEAEQVKPKPEEKLEETDKSKETSATTAEDGNETSGSELGQTVLKESKTDKKKVSVTDGGKDKKSEKTESEGKKISHNELDGSEKGKAGEKEAAKDKESEKHLPETRSQGMSEDKSSTIEALTATKEAKDEPTDKEKEILVPVIEDKEIKEPEPTVSAPVTSVKEREEQPLSPASSVMSNDTDGGGGAPVVSRGRGRRRQGGKSKGGRRSLRTTRGRNIVEEEKSKESEASSRAESTDDETGDVTLPESDDMTSGTTGKHQQIPFNDSVPNSPASITPGDTEDEKAFKLWKKSIMLVWRAAANHKYANVFSHPVTEEIAPGYHSVVFRYTNVFSHPVKEEIAPGYHSIVHRPLDLATIKKNIESGVIRTTVEFQRDMMQMFTNAIMYNNSDHDVCHMATEMYDDVMKHIEQYVHTQILVQGGDAKLLRPSRRSEAHSDKEDDLKRKCTDSDGGKAKKRKA